MGAYNAGIYTRAYAREESGCIGKVGKRESEIEKRLVDGVRKMGGRAYKFVSPGNDGVPDRIVIFPGQKPVFVELKTEKGRLTSLQTVQIDRLQKLGQDVRVLYGIEDVKGFLEAWQDEI